MIPEFVIVALDFYREPLRFSHLTNPRRPLPTGVNDVLTAPMNVFSDENIEETAALLNATVDECREVTPFFIKQVLLDSGGDYYRMLGVARNAETSQIRQHFQYLIRLFHPDRDVNDDNWDELYASRINKAYNTLRNTDKREKYDASLSVEAWDELKLDKVAVSPRPIRVVTTSSRKVTITPQARKLAIGLIALFVLVMALLVAKQTNQPSLRVQADESHKSASTLSRESNAINGKHDDATPVELMAGNIAESTVKPTFVIDPVDPVVVAEIKETVSTEEHIRRQVEHATFAVLGRSATKPGTKRKVYPVEENALTKESVQQFEQKSKPQITMAVNDEIVKPLSPGKKNVQRVESINIREKGNVKIGVSVASQVVEIPGSGSSPAIDNQANKYESTSPIKRPVQASESVSIKPDLSVPEAETQVVKAASVASHGVKAPEQAVERPVITVGSSVTVEAVQKSNNKSALPGEATVKELSAEIEKKKMQTELKMVDPTSQLASATADSSLFSRRSADPMNDAALFQLLAIFISSYESGNLDQFVGIFSDDAYTTDAKGYRAIHKLYKDFFNRPERRKIALTEFTWRDDTDGGKVGSGNIHLTAIPLNGGKTWNGDGTLKLVVIQAVDGLKISGMYYEIHDK